MNDKTTKDAVEQAYLKGASDALNLNVSDLPNEACKAANDYAESILGSAQDEKDD